VKTYAESITKPTKDYLKKEEGGGGEWKYNGRGELVHGTLYTFMEWSQ
jgi:hypothetical protein